jgi:hypothetical protein
LLVVAMLAAGSVSAQPSAQDRERARSLMDVGDQKFAANDYEAALKAFEAADRIMGVPTTTFEVGKTLEKLGRLIEARDAFIKVSRYPEKAAEPKAFATARQDAARLAQELAPRIPSLEIELPGLPAGVTPELALDGAPLQADLVGLPIKVNPGTHRVRASAPGFTSAEEEITLAEGETKKLSLALQPGESGSEPAGATTGDSRAGAAVEADTAAPSRTLMYVGFGVGAAGIAVGSVAGILSLSSASSAKEQCVDNRCRPEAQDDIDASRTMANVSNIGFVVGAVGIGVGVWQLLTVKDPPAERAAAPRPRVEPVIGPRSVGVVGTF